MFLFVIYGYVLLVEINYVLKKKVFFVIIFYMKYVVCVIFRKSIEKIEWLFNIV